MTIRFAVGDISFAWDERKAVTNRRKHGVTFEEAATAFLLVVHVERGDALRIISARVAGPGERATMGKRDA